MNQEAAEKEPYICQRVTKNTTDLWMAGKGIVMGMDKQRSRIQNFYFNQEGEGGREIQSEMRIASMRCDKSRNVREKQGGAYEKETGERK